ncbi:MAG TPA: RND family transporter [Verrucomicrobiota bacterium]|nr:RND family transporter [Verrucomicrobiota bacterium]
MAKWIRQLAVPITLGWLLLIGILTAFVPSLDVVGVERAVSVSPKDAPSVIAMMRVGTVFQESSTDNAAMIVLEGDSPLTPDARRYYSDLVAKLQADTIHVKHVYDFWGDPLTEASALSSDGKAVYVQVALGGNMGESLGNESVSEVQKIVKGTTPPPGVKVFVTGGSPMQADQVPEGAKSIKVVKLATVCVIICMLLFFYRSILTVGLVLVILGMGLSVTQGVVAFLAWHNVIGLTMYVTQILVPLALAATTDYAIFLFGRYQEARSDGQDRESAYYTMFRGTTHVVLASGMTIAGATFCLSFTRLPYFSTLGVPLGIGMVVAVISALTLGPSIVTVASRFGLLEPKRAMRIRSWRKVGALVARWPAGVLFATTMTALIGLIAVPGYKPNYDDAKYLPSEMPANQGLAAAERHFPIARMNPEMLLIETNQDLRNPAHFIVIDRITKAVSRVPGIGRVQSITRPDGKPLRYSTIPAQMSLSGSLQTMNRSYMQDRMADMLVQGDDMQTTINTMTQMIDLMEKMSGTMHDMVRNTDQTALDIADLRNHIADFDDFFRPIRNYLYWEPHCFEIPMCSAVRSTFESIDGVDTMTDDIQRLIPDLHQMDSLMPQMVSLMRPTVDSMKRMRVMMLTFQATQSGMQDQMAAMNEGSSAMAAAFNDSFNDDTFYAPPEIFDNDVLKRGMKNFVSPDGHATRFVVSHEDDPMSEAGMSRIDAIKAAVFEAIKGTPLEGSRVYLGGISSALKDLQEGNKYDLRIAGLAALSLVFIIMLLITRSVVAAGVIVGTVVLSLATSFGLSILFWQHILGMPLQFVVIAMAVIILLAVGSDYNLLLVARIREEVSAGINTGIIRAMGGSGSVVTTAGLVFAFTMMTMSLSSMIVVAQVGTTIGLGLLFDTLVIRAFMTPSIAALMGPWFWWPRIVRRRPLSGRPQGALLR